MFVCLYPVFCPGAHAIAENWLGCAATLFVRTNCSMQFLNTGQLSVLHGKSLLIFPFDFWWESHGFYTSHTPRNKIVKTNIYRINHAIQYGVDIFVLDLLISCQNVKVY